MRGALLCIVPGVFAAFFSLPYRTEAQDGAPCSIGSAMHYVSHQMDAGVRSVPYSATVKMSFEQQLPNGNAVHVTTLGHEARDSAGRIMWETPMGCLRGLDGQGHLLMDKQVYDPQEGHVSWQTGEVSTKQALVSPNQVSAPAPNAPSSKQEAKVLAQSPKRTEPDRFVPNAAREEDLGTRLIDGVIAEGHRRVQTVAAGEAGNDLAFDIVQETWFSRKLHLLLLSIDDDPRQGRSTMELQDLALFEPDPSVFVPPADYKLQRWTPQAPAHDPTH